MTTRLRNSSIPAWWVPGETPPRGGAVALRQALHYVARPLILVDAGGSPAVADDGALLADPRENALPVRAIVPALTPDRLGDPAFLERHGVRYAYVAGAMANGIASEDL